MKTFRGKIVACDITERIITIEVPSVRGAIMGQEVEIIPVDSSQDDIHPEARLEPLPAPWG